MFKEGCTSEAAGGGGGGGGGESGLVYGRKMTNNGYQNFIFPTHEIMLPRYPRK